MVQESTPKHTEDAVSEAERQIANLTEQIQSAERFLSQVPERGKPLVMRTLQKLHERLKNAQQQSGTFQNELSTLNEQSTKIEDDKQTAIIQTKASHSVATTDRQAQRLYEQVHRANRQAAHNYQLAQLAQFANRTASRAAAPKGFGKFLAWIAPRALGHRGAR